MTDLFCFQVVFWQMLQRLPERGFHYFLLYHFCFFKPKFSPLQLLFFCCYFNLRNKEQQNSSRISTIGEIDSQRLTSRPSLNPIFYHFYDFLSSIIIIIVIIFIFVIICEHACCVVLFCFGRMRFWTLVVPLASLVVLLVARPQRQVVS